WKPEAFRSLGPFASASAARAVALARSGHDGRTSVIVAREASAAHVARAIAALRAGVEGRGAPLMPRAEAALPTGRLPNGELGSGTARRRCPFLPRQRRTNQPAMGGPLLDVVLAFIHV